MVKQNICILINPKSGKGSSVKTGDWLAAKLTSMSVSFELWTTPWPESLEGFTEIWIIGGDGTINYFINKYSTNVLPLGFFKGGTGNDLAWNLYGDCTLEENFEKVWHGLPQRIDAAICNDRMFVNSSGIGFDGEVLKSIHQIRWLGGHLGYLAVVLKKIFSYKERCVRISIDNEKITGKYLLMIVNNSKRTGGGFMVTPTAQLNDGLLDFMLCEPLSVFRRLRYLPVIEKGRHLSLPFIRYSLVQKIVIECKSELFAQLDGELIAASTFSFKIIPGKLIVKC